VRPGRLGVVRWVISGILVLGTAAGCLGYPPPWRPSAEISAGPWAVRFWLDRERNERRRPLTADQEVDALEARLRAEVEAHLRARPGLDAAVTKALRDLRVAPGMRYEEVRLLVGEPRERSVTPDRLRYHAWHRWPVLAGRVDEVWIYRQYDNVKEYTVHAVYFHRGGVAAIVHYWWGLL
jgi:hypothetical protein